MKPRPQLLAGEDLPPAPSQERSRHKRARLLAAALASFGKNGYESTSIEQISDDAKLAVGTFYQHFRSKRQLLLALMDELLEKLSRLQLTPTATADVRTSLRALLGRAFASDLHYLGAYRAWREAALSDPDLARKQKAIHSWTTARVSAVFQQLQQLPGARPEVDIATLARVMDSFFWNLLAQAASMPKPELDRWIDTSTHLIHHALFCDAPAVSHARQS